MALFGINWEESKWPGHFCSIVLYFFASRIGVKLPAKKKVPWHQRGPVRARGSNCHFCKKNAFFGQKMTFFQKVQFLQNCSVTQNTVFRYVKNNFLLPQKKLVFFTILNLDMALHLGRTELELQATNLLICRHRSRLCLLQYLDVHGHWHCSCTMISIFQPLSLSY